MWAIRAIAILVVDDADNILLIRENETCEEVGKRAGMLSIPMGHIESGETPTAASLREFNEDTGLEADIDYPLGFFQIEMPDCNKAGIWAFKGHIVSAAKETLLTLWLSPKEFLAMHPSLLRPLNHEIFQAYALIKFSLGQNGEKLLLKTIISAMPKMAREALTTSTSFV